MSPAIMLNALWAAGLDLEVMGDTLLFSGNSRLQQPQLDALLAALKAHKPAILAFLREDAFRALCTLTQEQGLRWAVHDNGRAIMPDYGPGFTPNDVAFVEDIRLQATPLPHERRHELLRLQEQAERARLAKRGWRV